MLRGPIDILVTGAAGFIGGAMLRRCLAEGATAVGVDLRPTVQRLDITDPVAVEAMFSTLRPRVVVHAAARVDDRGPRGVFERINVVGTQNVYRAAARSGAERFVHVSSIAALGEDPGPHANADTPMASAQASPYFATKAAAERFVFEAREVPSVVVRPGDVYGPGSEPWVNRPLRLMARGWPVLIDGGRGLVAHTWIDGLVTALIAATSVADAVGGRFIVTDDVHDTQYGDYLRRLASAFGYPAPKRGPSRRVALLLARGLARVAARAPFEPPITPGGVRYLTRKTRYDNGPARAVLGHAPDVSLDEGIARLVPGG